MDTRLTKVVIGTFHDEKRASKALQALLDQSIPLEDISIVIRDAVGDEEDVPLSRRTRIGRGAVIGGALGAALAGTGATLVATGVLAAPGIGLLAAGPILTVVRGVVAGVAFGQAVGSLAGLDFLKARLDLHGVDLKNGAALIAVHSDNLHDVARQTLEKAGADRIST